MSNTRYTLRFTKPAVMRDECGEIRHEFKIGDEVTGAIQINGGFELTKEPTDRGLVYTDQVVVIGETKVHHPVPRAC